ncbi:hypothetical protein RCL1_002536 [Eukaryota sp. TZLM3-RCL]
MQSRSQELLHQRSLREISDTQKYSPPHYSSRIKQLRNLFTVERAILVFQGLAMVFLGLSMMIRYHVIELIALLAVSWISMIESQRTRSPLNRIVSTFGIRSDTEMHREVVVLKTLRKDFVGIESENAPHLLKVCSVLGVGQSFYVD